MIGTGTNQQDVDEHAESYLLKPANDDEPEPVGILLIHGFTASPTETRPFADFLQSNADWHCLGIRLEGHGISVQALEATDRFDWLDSAEDGYHQLLKAGCRRILLVGVSMGAVLCCHLASRHAQEGFMKGLVLMAPAFALPQPQAAFAGLLSLVRKRLPKTKETVRYLKDKGLFSYHEIPLKQALEVKSLGRDGAREFQKLNLPSLIFIGEKEDTVSITAVRRVHRRRADVSTLVTLPKSGHILTVEPEADRVFRESLRFMESCLNTE